MSIFGAYILLLKEFYDIHWSTLLMVMAVSKSFLQP